MIDAWNKKFTDLKREMERRGDNKGVQKLQFGRYVYWMRKLVPDLSQAKAAKMVGISRSQWIRMEEGKHLPRPHRIPSIADAIRTDINALYRKAGLEIPKKYAKYDLEAAKRGFGITVQEATSFQDFINRVQMIWQNYQQDQTGRRQRIYVDRAQSQLLDLIYNEMTLPQRIRLAHALVQDAMVRDVRAAVPNAQEFFDNLDRAINKLG
jgi:transcriptional regulator with XRE-family HTH domain